MFEVIRVDSGNAEALEPLGTKQKFWYHDGETRMLFKAEERGTGDDWAEKIACELCALLGLPHVHYEMAYDVKGDKPGVVCATCSPSPMALVLGNQLMLARDGDYPAAEGNRYKVREHTVDGVVAVLRSLGPPPNHWMTGVPPGVASALDVFAGYAMLDAWVANQDRHHENWGALKDGDRLLLAPTFDHGASLARNLSDAERHERLNTRDRNRRIEHFAQRAVSAFYGDAGQPRPLSTVAAWRAFAGFAGELARPWLDRLAAIDDSRVEALLLRVPPSRMSRICREFTVKLLQENRRRLLTEENK